MLLFACVITVFLNKFVSANVPDLAVLVNRFVIRTQVDPNEKPIRTAIYHYGDGDAVDVSCVTMNKQCTIELNYDYAERLHEAFKTANLLSHRIVGFRTKLQVKHNDTSMVCKYICPKFLDLSGIVKLKFILGDFKHDVNNKIKLKINGMIAREMSLYEYDDKIDAPLMYNSGNKTLNIEAHTNSAGINLKWYYNDTRTKIYYTNDTSMKIKLFSKNMTDLFIYISMDNFTRFIHYIKIHFVDFHVFEPFGLTLNLPKENTLMELYNYPNKQWFYYEYQNGDSITLNCSSSHPMRGMLISFNGTEERCKNSISKNFHLTAADDDTTHECTMKNTKETSIRTIVVVFKERKQNNIMLILGCSLGVAVLVLVMCILCWWKRRTVEKQNAQMYVNTRVEKNKKIKLRFPEPRMPAIQDVINQCQIEDKPTYANMSVEIQEKIKRKSNKKIPKRPEKSTKQNASIDVNREHVTPNENSSRQNQKPGETLIYDNVRHSKITRTIKCRNILNNQTQNNVISISESVEENVYDYAVGY